MCKFQIDGNRTNAHAGMPFLRYASVCRADFSVGFGRIDQGQQPVWGVGRLCLSSIRHAQPHLGKRNDLRLFCIHTKYGEVLCGTGVNSIGVNDGAFNEF